MNRILVALLAVAGAAGCDRPAACYIAPTASSSDGECSGSRAEGNGSVPGAASEASIPTSCVGEAAGVTCAIAADGGVDGGLGSCCGQGCSDLSSDPANCGACGHSCAIGETCQQGWCAVDACRPEFQGDPCHLNGGLAAGTCCGSTCLDTRADAQNCGGCNLACGRGAACVDSQCH